MQKSPLESPIQEIFFEVSVSTPSTSSQKNFFDKGEEEREAWGSLVTRLSERLGPKKAFMASPVQSYIPEKSWLKKMEISPPFAVSLPFPERPLRLLGTPLTLKKSENFFLHQNKKWIFLHLEGPEILHAAWWIEKIDRHYYRVLTQTGEQLWVYTTPHQDQVYLHGYFD